MMGDLSRYHQLVSDQARRRLDHGNVTAAHGAEGGDVSLAVAAARALVTDGSIDVDGLVDGFKYLAESGASWATVGVTPGMTTVPRDVADQAAPLMFADGAGHRRDVYHPLVLHLHMAAFAKHYETLPVSSWSACEDALPEAVAPARAIEAWAVTSPPPAAVSLVLWHALCLYDQANLTQRDIDMELVDAVVHHALAESPKGGPLCAADHNQSPDAWTYRELTGLHALSALALRRRNSAWASRVQEIATYHQDHTQPDYTTYQPWALFAFAWSEATQPFADQQLHDVASAASAGGGECDWMTGLLLADAADMLATFAS